MLISENDFHWDAFYGATSKGSNIYQLSVMSKIQTSSQNSAILANLEPLNHGMEELTGYHPGFNRYSNIYFFSFSLVILDLFFFWFWVNRLLLWSSLSLVNVATAQREQSEHVGRSSKQKRTETTWKCGRRRYSFTWQADRAAVPRRTACPSARGVSQSSQAQQRRQLQRN